MSDADTGVSDIEADELAGRLEYRPGAPSSTNDSAKRSSPSGWVALSPCGQSDVLAAATNAIAHVMEPYRPRVVFLSARTAP